LEKEIIQKIKFGNSPYLSNYFRLGLKRLLPSLKNKEYAGLVTIPSNRGTIRKRPIPVCLPVTSLIQKQLQINSINPFQKKSKELQSGKSFRDRFLHAQNAFEIKNTFINSLRGNYLLVDDVFTTGATINEIAKILLMNGAEKVDVLVLVKGKISHGGTVRLDNLASKEPIASILKSYPSLKEEHIYASIQYAADLARERVVII
jgi:ComF family protein